LARQLADSDPTSLLEWAFLIAALMQIIALVVNVTWGKHMNTVETLSIILHLVAILLLTALLIFARATNTVTTNFSITSDTGWSPSFGVVLDIVYAATVLTGFDCASHLAEDTVEPSRRVPRSLLWTAGLNMLACLIVAILIGLTAGNVGELFAQPLALSGHPFGSIVQLVFNCAQGRKDLASAPFGLFGAILLVCAINGESLV
jgi:choline transport protein